MSTIFPDIQRTAGLAPLFQRFLNGKNRKLVRIGDTKRQITESLKELPAKKS